jgi:hypothetical protein
MTVAGVSVPRVNSASATSGSAKADEAKEASTPKAGKPSIFSAKNIALGGLGAAALAAGGIIGKLRGHTGIGLAIGGAAAAVAVGAALVGSAGASQRDGWCDYYGDPDCDYPGTYDPYRPYDPGYPSYPSYPDPYDPYYPEPGYGNGGTSWGDD